MASISVDLKGEQRNGEEVYTIVVTRSAGTRTLNKTKTEVKTIQQRESVRFTALAAQIQGASMDGTSTVALQAELDATAKLQKDIIQAVSLME